MVDPIASEEEVRKKTRELLARNKLTMRNLQEALGYKLARPERGREEGYAKDWVKRRIVNIIKKDPELLAEILRGKMDDTRAYREFFGLSRTGLMFRILGEIRKNPLISREELSIRLNVSEPTVTSVVYEAAADGNKVARRYVEEGSIRHRLRLRPGQISPQKARHMVPGYKRRRRV